MGPTLTSIKPMFQHLKVRQKTAQRLAKFGTGDGTFGWRFPKDSLALIGPLTGEGGCIDRPRFFADLLQACLRVPWTSSCQ